MFPSIKKEPFPFQLSDATALLLRLEMENCGLDLKNRWREVANLYENIVDDTATVNLFYDYHALIGLLYGGPDTKKVKCTFENRDQVK